LTIYHLTFDPTNVTKHDITYITLLKVRWKEILHLLSPWKVFSSRSSCSRKNVLIKNKCTIQTCMDGGPIYGTCRKDTFAL
jgi:hypothetical protein